MSFVCNVRRTKWLFDTGIQLAQDLAILDIVVESNQMALVPTRSVDKEFSYIAILLLLLVRSICFFQNVEFNI